MNAKQRRELVQRLRAFRVESGLINCHHIGLHSVILDHRADGSLLRIFYAAENHTMDKLFLPDGRFVVAAHNHNKRLRFTTLFGEVWNVSLRLPLSWRGFHVSLIQYPFTSGMTTGEFVLGKPRQYQAEIALFPIDGYDMSTRKAHTVLVPSRTAAWLVDEGPEEEVPKSIYSPVPLTLDITDLYLPMDRLNLENVCMSIADGISLEGAHD